MNYLNEQTQLSDQTVLGVKNASAIQHNIKQAYQYIPDSKWSNVKYLIGVLLVIIGLSKIPGVSYKGLMVASAVMAIGIYIVAFVVKLVLVMRQSQAKKRKYFKVRK